MNLITDEERIEELRMKIPKRGWSFKKTFIWAWDEWLLKIWNKIRRKR